MADTASQKYENHNVIYEGHKYKLIQLLDEDDFVMNEDGPHYDCLFLNKSRNQSLGTFRYVDAEMVEVTNMLLDGTLRFKNVKRLIEQLPRLTNSKLYARPNVGAVSATISANKDGTFTVTAMTQWGNQMTFKTMKELALEAPMFIHRAFNEQDRGTY